MWKIFAFIVILFHLLVSAPCPKHCRCPPEVPRCLILNYSFHQPTHPVGHMIARGVKCVSQTTAWFPCSKSCGTEMIKRMTNYNSKCKLVTDTWICEVHPCDQRSFSSLKKGKKCNLSEKMSHPVKLLHSGCHTLKKVHCGSCSNERCLI